MSAFAAIEAATVTATVAALANCTVTIGAVSGISAVFDNGYANAFMDVAGSQPSLLLPASSVGSAAVGSAITVGSTSYTIAEIQPDGTGMTRLVLES